MGFSDFDLEAFLASAEMQGGFKGLPKWCPGAAFGTKMSDVTVIGVGWGGYCYWGGWGGYSRILGRVGKLQDAILVPKKCIFRQFLGSGIGMHTPHNFFKKL